MKKYLILALVTLVLVTTVNAEENANKIKTNAIKIGVEHQSSMRYIRDLDFITGEGVNFSLDFIIENNWIFICNLGYDYYRLDSNTQNTISNKAMNLTMGIYKVLFSKLMREGQLVYMGLEGGSRFEKGSVLTYTAPFSTPLCYFVGGFSLIITRIVHIDFKIKSFLMFDNRVSAGISLYLQ